MDDASLDPELHLARLMGRKRGRLVGHAAFEMLLHCRGPQFALMQPRIDLDRMTRRRFVYEWPCSSVLMGVVDDEEH